MSQSSESGPDFHLPDEILSIIPTDPYDQLDLARKITSMAIAARVSKLEADVGRLKQRIYDKDRLILELEERVLHLEQAYNEADTRLKIACDENMKLSKERESLALTVKKLGRNLAKLETFKKQLMQSLNDDNMSQAEIVDIVMYDQSVPKSITKEEDLNDHKTNQALSRSIESGYGTDDASKQAVKKFSKFSVAPHITPRFTPTETPKIKSTSGSPVNHYSAGVSPQKTSGTTSPFIAQYEGRGSLSSWYPSSQQSSAANSPPRSQPGRTLRVVGKELFRQARNRLTYEQFSAFLANVKEFNAQKQSREETLRKAEEIFGLANKDLYLSFQGLLSHKIH
ncbi:hypothetical protein NMG60_11001965 [Bertholletia excelsa]